MIPSKLLYVMTQAPYSNASGQEALDAVLIGASFDQQVSVLFLHDGVFQLMSNQDGENSELKIYTKTFKALEDFGVENIYIHDLSLLARGVREDELMIGCQTLDNIEISALISQQDRVFTF